MPEPIQHRHEFAYYFDVEFGNPNGDPDAGNMPRLDYETNRGIVTDVCLKRKIRNYVELAKDGAPGHAIYVRERAVLNREHQKAYEALGLKPDKQKLPKDEDKARAVTDWMCSTYFDIRTFGAVMTTEVNCGQVRGPVQLAFSQSVDAITPQEISITRMAVTNERDLEKERTMGRKYVVPYALYRCDGFVSAALARRTGFSDADLDLLWQALAQMFDHDRSAARGRMAARGLVVFRHDGVLGNAPAHALLDRVAVERVGDPAVPARSFADYRLVVKDADLPAGVTMERRL